MASISAIILILALILLFFYGIFQFFFFKWRQLRPLKEHEQKVIKTVLSRKTPYFQKLSYYGQSKFVTRVTRLMNSFQFIGRRGIEMNTEIKALICSAMAQVTFGWRKYDFDRFTRIEVYPNLFRLSPHLPKMQGASHPSGILVFSWQHIVFGYEVEDDGLNVAIHEIAHALKINYLEESVFQLHKRYKDWLDEAVPTFNQIQTKNDPVFRKRAAENMHEFFAVCLENFFERPKLMLDHHPRIYGATCLLLNQNPLNYQNDYKLNRA